MDLNKSYSRNQIEITNLRKWLQRHSMCVEKKEILSAEDKQYQQSLKWNCLDCGVLLSSESQAQEHFLGKKHQNVLKNKALCNLYSKSKINLTCGNFSTFGNNLLLKRTLQSNCNSESYSFNNYLEPKSCLHNIIPLSVGKDNILETVIKSERINFSSPDLSIYRTPSGKYYCQLCNLTVNSQAQFLQHSESKKHKHKASKNFKLK